MWCSNLFWNFNFWSSIKGDINAFYPNLSFAIIELLLFNFVDYKVKPRISKIKKDKKKKCWWNYKCRFYTLFPTQASQIILTIIVGYAHYNDPNVFSKSIAETSVNVLSCLLVILIEFLTFYQVNEIFNKYIENLDNQ